MEFQRLSVEAQSTPLSTSSTTHVLCLNSPTNHHSSAVLASQTRWNRKKENESKGESKQMLLSRVHIAMLPQQLHSTTIGDGGGGRMGLRTGSYVGVDCCLGSLNVAYDGEIMHSVYALIAHALWTEPIPSSSSSSSSPSTATPPLASSGQNVLNFGLRVHTEELQITLQVNNNEKVTCITARDTVTGINKTNAGTTRLAGTVGGLGLQDLTTSGQHHVQVVTDLNMDEPALVNWTVEMVIIFTRYVFLFLNFNVVSDFIFFLFCVYIFV